jgi:hypothetical protein
MRRLLLLTTLLLSCNGGDPTLGLRAILRVAAPASLLLQNAGTPLPGAQFFPGAMPKAKGGPKVTAVDNLNSIIFPGQLGKPLNGRVGAGGQVVAVGLDGAIGYWIVPVGQLDIVNPTEPDFSLQADFSSALSLGDHVLHFQAGDASNSFGEPTDLKLTAKKYKDPQGLLIVRLTWDTEADVDLHVQQPDGADLWAKRQTTFVPPAPGEPNPTPAELQAGGIVQFDSNGRCVIDGAREETIVWKTVVPTGTFTVRADAFSMCGQVAANWKLQVEQRTDPKVTGTILATASGTLYPRDTAFPHVDGSGAFATTFTIH